MAKRKHTDRKAPANVAKTHKTNDNKAAPAQDSSDDVLTPGASASSQAKGPALVEMSQEMKNFQLHFAVRNCEEVVKEGDIAAVRDWINTNSLSI